ncbi:MAG: imidazole glycerol phosphate synthase subunit HisH [Planctomycetes bacterium]|nr:imidazole glycerol phosphate synthase subunit HisH [Planctomycetota bacterium]
MIAIVDYGLGNLSSVAGVVERLGHEPRVTSDPDELAAAEKLILPGVGAFGDGMANLRRLELVEPLSRLVLEQGKPILGICLGAQLMAGESEEFGRHEGMGWIDARVIRIETGDPSLRVPHVGWNDVVHKRPSVLFRNIPPDALFYFVHSYHIRCADEKRIAGETLYGIPIAAVIEQGNVYATQFHPEKSQRHGLTLLGNFLAAG